MARMTSQAGGRAGQRRISGKSSSAVAPAADCPTLALMNSHSHPPQLPLPLTLPRSPLASARGS